MTGGWPRAETAGDAIPYGPRHLLGRAVQSAEAVQVEHVENPGGVVVVNETDFPKQGTHSAEVSPQYCGHAGQGGQLAGGSLPGLRRPPGAHATGWELYPTEGWTKDGVGWPAVGLAPTGPSRPSRSGPGICWNGRARPGCRRPG